MNPQKILSDSRLEHLFARTFEHPVLRGKIDLVSIEWLLDLANPTPAAKTDLGTWEADAPLVDWDTLYANIEQLGMRDPFILGVGKLTRKVRLEAGNQRVRAMQMQGLLFVPAVAYVGDSSVSHAGNGTHEGRSMALWLPESSGILGPYPEKTYARPSEVIPSCPALKFDGWPAR
jgi:hypothetical protein